MGGADRAERRRRQQNAQDRLSAAGISPAQRRGPGGNRTALIVVAAVVAVAVVVGVVFALTRSSGSETPPSAATIPVSVDGGVVVAGKADAKVTVDVYEDFLCPACQRFEQVYGGDLTEALNAGTVRVRHHMITILDSRSKPAGYSSLAANAGLCAAAAGIYPGYHSALFAQQPSEGGPGLPVDTLVSIGTGLGATGDFEQCVRSSAKKDAVVATEAAALKAGVNSTPSVLVGGEKVDVSNRNWLKEAIGS